MLESGVGRTSVISQSKNSENWHNGSRMGKIVAKHCPLLNSKKNRLKSIDFFGILSPSGKTTWTEVGNYLGGFTSGWPRFSHRSNRGKPFALLNSKNTDQSKKLNGCFTFSLLLKSDPRRPGRNRQLHHSIYFRADWNGGQVLSLSVTHSLGMLAILTRFRRWRMSFKWI